MINPALTQMMQMQQQQQPQAQPQSPISSGALAGMQAAREATMANQEQKNNALGMALMHMGHRMGNPESDHGPGFAGALGRVNESIFPAGISYRNSMNMDEKNNRYLLEAAIKNQMNQEDSAFQRQKFEADQNYNNRYLGLMERKLKKEDGESGITAEGIDLSRFPTISGTAAKNALVKEKRNTGAILHEIDEIEKDLEKFENITKKNVFNPVNPYTSKVTNAVKDFTSTSFRNKKGLEERDLRKRLESKLLVFRTEAERRLKGGVLSQGLAKRFEDKNALPSLNEEFSITRAKLDDLKRKALSANESAKVSLKYGRHIDSDEIEALNNAKSIGQDEAIEQNNQAQEQQAQQGGQGVFIEKIKNQFPGFSKYSDEQILEWAKTRGLE